MVVNDFEEDVVIRSVLLLLIATLDDCHDPVDTMLHIWYSGRITSKHIETIRTQISPMCVQYSRTPSDFQDKYALYELNITLPRGSITIALPMRLWKKINVLIHKTHHSADTEINRKAVMLARRDHFDRCLFLYHLNKSLSQRSSRVKFRETGVLLPFGASHAAFTVTNMSVSVLVWYQKLYV